MGRHSPSGVSMENGFFRGVIGFSPLADLLPEYPL
jgi:hypothetical protein